MAFSARAPAASAADASPAVAPVVARAADKAGEAAHSSAGDAKMAALIPAGAIVTKKDADEWQTVSYESTNK